MQQDPVRSVKQEHGKRAVELPTAHVGIEFIVVAGNPVVDIHEDQVLVVK